MAKAEKTNNKKGSVRPALSPEAQENLMISLANDLALKQLQDGTASSQMITHFLKLGSSRERLEQERISVEVSLTKTKQETLESAKGADDMYAKALSAIREYQGRRVDDIDDI